MFNLSDFRFPTLGKGLFLKGAAAFLIGITLSLALLNLAGLPNVIIPNTGSAGHPALLKFSSYEELKDFLNRSITYRYHYDSVSILNPPTTFTVSPKGSNVEQGGVDYSKTNIQVAGVDEADIVKSDGEYIYLSSNGNVLIVKAYPPQSAEVVARIPSNGTIGIFVDGNRLVIFESGNEFSIGPIVRQYYYDYYGGQSFIKVYDIGNRRNPVLLRNISVNGSYFDSRMIGDYIYVLINSPATLLDKEVYLPAITDNGQIEKIEASSVYYSNISDYSYTFMTVLSINIQNTQSIAHETILCGRASSIYVSTTNIYVAAPKYEYGFAEKTEIHRIQIDNGDVKYEASGEILGYVLNQFSMDEYNGYFRIATTTTGYIPRGIIAGGQKEPIPVSQVYVLNLNLDMVGNLTKLAPGETIYSARFIGERCYLVTFKKIDPFFVIGLENPAVPRVLGKLKIPGYSDYLHPYDENHLIGIGKWTVEAKEGDFAWYQGVKISLFDVRDVENPREAANISIGDRGTDSPVLRDHKALLFDKTRGLLAIPVLVAKINEAQYPNGIPPNAYGDYVGQGLYVFDITENSITLRGGITHANATEFMKSGWYFSSDYSIERALYIGDVLYTISARMIKMNSLTNLAEINELRLS